MSLPVVLLIAIAGLIAGFVRGYSGFGFGLAAIPILTIALLPQVAVPAILLLELLLAVVTVGGVRGQVAYPALRWMILGTFLGTPIGVVALINMSPDAMRIAIGLIVVIAVIVLWRRNNAIAGGPRPISLITAGFISGLLNGGTAMSGPPVIIVLLSSGASALVARATIMGFVAMSALLGVIISSLNGLYTSRAFLTALVLIPCSIIGAGIGDATFRGSPDAHYRRISLLILLTVALAAIAAAGWHLYHPTSLREHHVEFGVTRSRF